MSIDIRSMSFQCRLCAAIKLRSDIIDVENSTIIHLNLEYKIYHCLGIQLMQEQKLPKTICKQCSQKLNTSYDFYEQVQRAQEILRKQLINIEDDKNLVKLETSDFDDPSVDSLEDISIDAASPKEEHVSEEKVNNKCNKQNVYSKEHKKIKFKYQKDRQVRLKNEGSISLKNIRINLSKEWKHYEWQCTDCKEKLSTIDSLRNHCTEVHNKSAQYMCADCSKVFDVYGIFKRHVRAHKNQNKFCCNECGRCFHLKKHLERHEETHSSDRNYICAKCGKSFKTSNSLRSHGRAHLPSDVKYKYECDVCHKKLSTKPNLLCHKKLHTGIKEYTCDQCGKSFMQKGNLDQHLLTIHSDITPFNCEKCFKKFKTPSSLKTHLKIHSEFRPHGCDVCGKSFHRKGTLTRHKSVHNDDLPFECEYCKKCFRMKTFLKIHLRQHTGERPYSCMECNHHFTDSSNYIKHMKGRHGVNSVAKSNALKKVKA